MMDDYFIRFYAKDVCSVDSVLSLDKFIYSPNKKWKLIQKLCFYVLSKIGAYAMEEKVEFKEVKIYNTMKLEEYLYRQILYLFNRDIKPKVIYIGVDKILELDLILLEDKYKHGYSSTNMELFGVPVRILHYMEGAIVIGEE